MSNNEVKTDHIMTIICSLYYGTPLSEGDQLIYDKFVLDNELDKVPFDMGIIEKIQAADRSTEKQWAKVLKKIEKV